MALKPVFYLIIDSEVMTSKNGDIIVPVISAFPRLSDNAINKILDITIGLSIEDIITLIKNGNDKLKGSYIFYKTQRGGYIFKRVKEGVEIPRELIKNHVKLPCESHPNF